jgi:hypothetical protein
MLQFPSYQRNENSPSIHPISGGIAIASVPVVKLRKAPVFPLFGSFTVPKKSASEFHGHLLQAVVILLRGPHPVTRNLGGGELLFEDDLLEEEERIHGFFNLDLFAFFNLVEAPNRYRVNVSIFQYLSNVLTVDVVA